MPTFPRHDQAEGEAGAQPSQRLRDAILRKLRSTCSVLPEATEERAWVGTRWKVRSKTFVHVPQKLRDRLL